MKLLTLLLCVITLTCSTSVASETERCINSAGIKYNIAHDIIRCIIDIESANKEYAVNIGGESYYPTTYDNAVVLIAENLTKSFDIGIMQINKWWFDRFEYEYTYGLDLCFNIHLGSWILAYEISRHGYTWEAIGRYHSHTEAHKNAYIEKMRKCLKR